nr:hypothetical protein [Tanacetum cinerariifolium]
MEPEENDRDDEKSEGDFIDYPTSQGDNDVNDDGDDLSEDEEEPSDSEEEEEEHLAPTVPTPALYSFVSASEETKTFEEDIPLRKRARFTTPTSRYEIGESSVVATAARQIRPTLTIADKSRADDKLIGRLKRERRYFRTLATTYAKEDAHSRDYCTRIMDYC